MYAKAFREPPELCANILRFSFLVIQPSLKRPDKFAREGVNQLPCRISSDCPYQNARQINLEFYSHLNFRHPRLVKRNKSDAAAILRNVKSARRLKVVSVSGVLKTCREIVNRTELTELSKWQFHASK